MNIKKWTVWSVFAAATAFGSVAIAQSQPYSGDDAEEVAAVSEAKVGLAEAVSAAERETSGKAIEAQIEVEGTQAFYEIDVFSEGDIKEVRVSAEDGKILDVRED